jgi:hypothetical protein
MRTTRSSTTSSRPARPRVREAIVGKLDGLLSPAPTRWSSPRCCARTSRRLHGDRRRLADHRRAGPTYTVTRGAGSWLTDGVKAGMVVPASAGALNAANLSKNLLVMAPPPPC